MNTKVFKLALFLALQFCSLLVLSQEKIDFELQSQKDLTDAKIKLEELFTDKYKIELQKREDALAQSVDRQIALATKIPSLIDTSFLVGILIRCDST